MFFSVARSRLFIASLLAFTHLTNAHVNTLCQYLFLMTAFRRAQIFAQLLHRCLTVHHQRAFSYNSLILPITPRTDLSRTTCPLQAWYVVCLLASVLQLITTDSALISMSWPTCSSTSMACDPSTSPLTFVLYSTGRYARSPLTTLLDTTKSFFQILLMSPPAFQASHTRFRILRLSSS